VRSTLSLIAVLMAGSCRQTAPSEPASGHAPGAAEAPARPRVEGPAVVIHTRGNVERVVHVEVARTDATRMRGLMFRRDMEDDHGMIFVFRDPAHQTFWMHNTLIPLDMIFIRADRTILGVVRNATPETDDPRDVPGDSQYVLEVNGGWCQRNNVNAGDRVELLDVGPPVD
jgi:uncharacterized membrane protein (UPF0127 family)